MPQPHDFGLGLPLDGFVGERGCGAVSILAMEVETERVLRNRPAFDGLAQVKTAAEPVVETL